ncbi:MAG: hypothetical protein JWM90_851, partial [Thermoleophilia bacterium]|nr:hypothetical protein [Thermoleophilia bacterium]
MNRTATALTTIALAALLATGCGGGPPEISKVESCLKGLKLDVERSDTKEDPDVTEGLSARTKPTEREFTIALAATAKSDAKVKSFTKRFRETVDQMDAQQEAEF